MKLRRNKKLSVLIIFTDCLTKLFLSPHFQLLSGPRSSSTRICKTPKNILYSSIAGEEKLFTFPSSQIWSVSILRECTSFWAAVYVRNKVVESTSRQRRLDHLAAIFYRIQNKQMTSGWLRGPSSRGDSPLPLRLPSTYARGFPFNTHSCNWEHEEYSQLSLNFS